MMKLPIAVVAPVIAFAPSLVAQSEAVRPLASLSVDTAAHLGSRDDLPSTCFASISPASMSRDKIFLEALLPAHTDSAFASQADLMAEDVATELEFVTNKPVQMGKSSTPRP
jgi:hypothetical protein